MNKVQTWLLVVAALIGALGLLLKGRYEWCPGQDFGRSATYYPPRVLDTWTGKWESL